MEGGEVQRQLPMKREILTGMITKWYPEARKKQGARGMMGSVAGRAYERKESSCLRLTRPG